MNNIEFKKIIQNINGLYSEDKLEASKERLRKVWNKTFPIDRVPFVFNDFIEGMDNDFIFCDYYEAKYDYETHLYYGLKLIENHTFLEDDYIPTLFPGVRQALIPSIFGAKEKLKDYHYWVEPVVSNLKDIEQITAIKPIKSKLFKDFISRILFFRKYVKDSVITIHMPDMQGSIDIASLLLGTENLFYAMIDKPDNIHVLLDKITNILCIVIDKLLEITDGEIIPIHAEPIVWVPPGKGFSFSEDLLAVISPDLYQEFAIPYNNILSKKYGGFFSHSCGSFSHNLNNLLKIDGFIGVNFQVTEQDLYKVLEIFGNKALLVCGWGDTVKYIDWSPEEYIRKSFKAVKKYKAPSVIMIPTFFESVDFKASNKFELIKLNKLALEISKI